MASNLFNLRILVETANEPVFQAIASFEDFLSYFRSRQFGNACRGSNAARNTICYFVVTLKRLLSEDNWPIRSLERFLRNRDGRMQLVMFKVFDIINMADLKRTTFYRVFKKARDEVIRQIDRACIFAAQVRFAARGIYNTPARNPPNEDQEQPAALAVRPRRHNAQEQEVQWLLPGMQRNGNPGIGRGYIIGDFRNIHWARRPDALRHVANYLFRAAEGAFAAGWNRDQLLEAFVNEVQGTLTVLFYKIDVFYFHLTMLILGSLSPLLSRRSSNKEPAINPRGRQHAFGV